MSANPFVRILMAPLPLKERTSRMTAILVKVVPSPYSVVRATVYKPNLGKQIKKDKLEDIEKKYRKVGQRHSVLEKLVATNCYF